MNDIWVIRAGQDESEIFEHLCDDANGNYSDEYAVIAHLFDGTKDYLELENKPKINISELEYYPSFEMEEAGQSVKIGADAAKYIGNLMKYNGSEVIDIGFEDAARDIYYGRDAEITKEYADAIMRLIKDCPLIAAIKRRILQELSKLGG